ncbi:MAG: sugar kinase [Woeseiaceae bacterium]|nr:sugar kinase [Woeseiaceae bacterium]
MPDARKIAVIGECMIELRPSITAAGYANPTIDAEIGYGGDTLNVATYLARQGVDVQYVTVLGDDPLSDWMVDQWRSNGVGCELVRREARGLPGMYWINVDASGERSFHYWRLESPARRLINDDERRSRVFEQLQQFDSLYFSGITLALYREPARARLFEFLAAYRNDGGQVCFDNNFRPRQWPDAAKARAAFEAMYRVTDIALPTAVDERHLFGDASNEAVIERLRGWGIREIVLKRGAEGSLVADDTGITEVPAVLVETVVDTTAAGDSFNAGYLAARFGGAGPEEAAKNGSRLASIVVQHRGAIIPREAMQER